MSARLRLPDRALNPGGRNSGERFCGKLVFALAIAIASNDNVSMLMDAKNSIAFLLHDVSRQVRYRFDARTRALGVTRPQWRALMLLARQEGVSQSELADLLDVERITLCRMVDRLAEAELVERRADPQDRRVWRLHLMPKAHAIVEQLTAIGADIEQEALSALSPAEQTMLWESLSRMREALSARARDDKPVQGPAGELA